MSKLLKVFSRILLGDRISSLFLLSVLLSVSFSIGIILSTIGLMDGFQNSLTLALRHSLGDIVLVSRSGLYTWNDDLEKRLEKTNLKDFSSAYQVEGFFISGQGERGVRVLGVRGESYQRVTGHRIALQAKELAIGKEIAKAYDLSGGDKVSMAFVTSNKKGDTLPALHQFVVKQIIDHNVFEKDARMVYVDRGYMASIGLSQKDNIIFGSFANKNLSSEHLKMEAWRLRKKIGKDFKASLFGGEYQSLLQAVELEKVSISIILQIIVLVAVFNIAAFMSFISEKKARDFFLLRALGVPFRGLCGFWILFIVLLWGSSCVMAIFMTSFFDYLLQTLPWFKLPAQVYVLSGLGINLTIEDYVMTFLGAGLWIVIVSGWSLFKMGRKSLLSGLREEFN